MQHAQTILTNNPSVKTIGGVAIFNDDKITHVAVTSQFLGDKGKLGILRAVQDELTDAYLDDTKMTHGSDDKFRKAMSEFCAKMGLIYRYNIEDLDHV